MKTLILASITALAASSCCHTADRPNTTAGDGPDFVSIFDGESLDGWRPFPAETASDWSVRDGVILAAGSEDRQSYLVWREEDLADFEMKFSYRMLTDGNTGLEVRSHVDTTGKRPFEGYHADFGHVGIGPQVLGAWDFHFATREEPPCHRGTRLVIDPDGTLHLTKIDGALTAEDVNKRDWNDVHIIAPQINNAPEGTTCRTVSSSSAGLKGKRLAIPARLEQMLTGSDYDVIHDMGVGWYCDLFMTGC